MESFAKKFFLFGFVPTLFGGLVLEESKGHFTNLVHLYFWLFLFVVPFIIAVLVPNISITLALIYPLILAALYAAILWANSFFHSCFDRDIPVTTTTVIQDEQDGQPTERRCRVCNTTFRSRLSSRLCLPCLLRAEESSDLSVREAWPIWFHGNISRRSAESMLSRIRPGSFLVRFSSKNTGDLVLSFRNRGGPIHFLISFKNGEYSIGDTAFTTLSEAIEHYTSHVLNDGMPLLYPVPSATPSADRRRESDAQQRQHRRRTRSRLSLISEGQPIEFFEDNTIADLLAPPSSTGAAAASAAAAAASPEDEDGGSTSQRTAQSVTPYHTFQFASSLDDSTLSASPRAPPPYPDAATPALHAIAEATSESPVPSSADPHSTAATAGDAEGAAAASEVAPLRLRLLVDTVMDPDPNFAPSPLTLAALIDHYADYIPTDTAIAISESEDPATTRQAFLHATATAAITAVETAMNTMSANARMWQDNGQEETAAECVRLASQYRPILDQLVEGHLVSLANVPLRVSPLSADDFQIFGIVPSPARQRRTERRETRPPALRLPTVRPTPMRTAGLPQISVDTALHARPPPLSLVAPPPPPHSAASLDAAVDVPTITIESAPSSAPPVPPRAAPAEAVALGDSSSRTATPSLAVTAATAATAAATAAAAAVARSESASLAAEAELTSEIVGGRIDEGRSLTSSSSVPLHSGSDRPDSAPRAPSPHSSAVESPSAHSPSASVHAAVAAAADAAAPTVILGRASVTPPPLFTPVPVVPRRGSLSPLPPPDGHSVPFAVARCGEADLTGVLMACGCSTFHACSDCHAVTRGYPCCGEGYGAPCSRPTTLYPLSLTPSKRPPEPPSSAESDEADDDIRATDTLNTRGSPSLGASAAAQAPLAAGEGSPTQDTADPAAAAAERQRSQDKLMRELGLESLTSTASEAVAETEEPRLYVPRFTNSPRRSLQLAMDTTESSTEDVTQDPLSTPAVLASAAAAAVADTVGDTNTASSLAPPAAAGEDEVRIAVPVIHIDESAPSVVQETVASSSGGVQGSAPASVTGAGGSQADSTDNPSHLSDLYRNSHFFSVLPMSVNQSLSVLPYFHPRCTRERAEAALMATQVGEPINAPKQVIALYSFQAVAPDELSFERGAVLDLVDGHDSNWWQARDQSSDREGCVPSNYVVATEALPQPRDGTFMVWALRESRSPLCMSIRHGDHVDHIRVIVTLGAGAASSPMYSIQPVDAFDNSTRPAVSSQSFQTMQGLVDMYRHSAVPELRCGSVRLTEFVTQSQINRQSGLPPALPPRTYLMEDAPENPLAAGATSSSSPARRDSLAPASRDSSDERRRRSSTASTSSTGQGRRHRPRFYSIHHRHSLVEHRHFGHGWICDVCGNNAAEDTQRFRCSHECDFDLCQGCLNSSLQDAAEHREAFHPNHDGRGSTAPNLSLSRAKTNVHLFGRTVSLPFDRLQLTTMVDQMQVASESLFCIILAFLTPFAGLMISYLYSDLGLFVLWLVVASALYSLLKSVQPDGGCFMLGTRITAYSRSLFFCVLAGLVLLLETGARGSAGNNSFYGVPFPSPATIEVLSQTLQILILCIPALFLFNIIPCWKTFSHYLLEQLDMHVFGGSGTASLWSSLIIGFLDALFAALLFCVGLRANYDCTDRACAGNVVVSVFGGFALSFAFLLARLDPDIIGRVLRIPFFQSFELPSINYLISLLARFVLLFVVFTVIALSTVFTSLQPAISTVFYAIACGLGFVAFVLHDLRIVHPWGLLRAPLIAPVNLTKRGSGFAELAWVEKLLFAMRLVEQYVAYPVILLCCIARDRPTLVSRFGQEGGAAVLSVVSLKFARLALSNRRLLWLSLVAALLFFNYDFDFSSQSLLVDIFVAAIIIYKLEEFVLKLRYVLTYNCPWNQRFVAIQPHLLGLPLSVPHFGFTVLQCLATAFFSMPIAPIIASPIFLPSYLRPVKFWEKEYHTKRREAEQSAAPHGTTNMASNLNSLYYQHMLTQLETYLARDLLLGHWGEVSLGDVFVLTDFENHMTAFVHIVGLGCDFVRFQLRGLEFGGTFCHARELEALEHNVQPFVGQNFVWVRQRVLPLGVALQRRWLTWRNVQHSYQLPGYSISTMKGGLWFLGNDAMAAQSRNLTLSLIYLVSISDHLASWLAPDALPSMQRQLIAGYVDKDRMFRAFEPDHSGEGIDLTKFYTVYGEWLRLCMQRRVQDGGTAGAAVTAVDTSQPTSRIVQLCYGLSLALRRVIIVAARKHLGDTDAFLHGLLVAFSGQVDPVHLKDEWISEGEGLIAVMRRAARISLIVHKEYITDPSATTDYEYLYPALQGYTHPTTGIVVCPESEPAWSDAVMRNHSSLISLRFNRDDTSDNKEFFIIVLTRMTRTFRISKVNRESVRGFWAAQQQEVLWLRNTYTERGSIQNAAPVLRNLINQSCDQPIGYPTFVSPLTVSSLPDWDYLSVFSNVLRSLRNISLFSKPSEQVRGRQDTSEVGGRASRGGSGARPLSGESVELTRRTVSITDVETVMLAESNLTSPAPTIPPAAPAATSLDSFAPASVAAAAVVLVPAAAAASVPAPAATAASDITARPAGDSEATAGAEASKDTAAPGEGVPTRTSQMSDLSVLLALVHDGGLGSAVPDRPSTTAMENRSFDFAAESGRDSDEASVD
eukprot:m.133629 g.133629  ORF g.133629 m.133629 type:complete len:2661 (+) comp14833_c1_seq5:150-8132(+)